MTGWSDFEEELDRWAEMGAAATFWWRDDDAVEDTPALRRLLEVFARFGVPLAVAAIPARAEESLASALSGASEVSVLQHGYAHRNHASDTRAKSELGPERPLSAVLEELSAGRTRMDAVFGDVWLPILVPPWNRIDASVASALPDQGYRGLSAMGERDPLDAAPGFTRIDVHMDLIDWPTTRKFTGDGAVLGAALRHLQFRRTGDVNPNEPTGLMTHHLAHDDGCWAFIDAFFAATTRHPGARWVDATSAFGLNP